MKKIEPFRVKSFTKIHEIITTVSGVFISTNTLNVTPNTIIIAKNVFWLSIISMILGVWGIMADAKQVDNYKSRIILACSQIFTFIISLIGVYLLRLSN